MALIELNYQSEVLKIDVSVNVILPDKLREGQETYKTLYLLHGLTADQTSWLRKSSIERYAAHHGIAVVMPYAGRSWYVDSVYGKAWFTFVTKELPAVCRKYFRGMSERREDNLVAGMSMGGYGAVKAALSCPDVFGGCAVLSGSLDITRRGRVISEEFIQEWRGIFGESLNHPQELEGSKHDLFAMAEAHKKQGLPFPKLYMWCGTGDRLLDANRRFHSLMEELGVPHQYVETEGDHSWRWWDQYIREALDFLLKEEIT